jgi:hypothetical protein
MVQVPQTSAEPRDKHHRRSDERENERRQYEPVGQVDR